MQRSNKPQAIALASYRSAKLHDDDDDDQVRYLTYRPLSNLPTPPPTYKEAAAVCSPSAPATLDDGEPLQARFIGTLAFIPSPQSMLTECRRRPCHPPRQPHPLVGIARLRLRHPRSGHALPRRSPLETVALAVCVLDSLDSKFARAWRLCCPLLPSTVGAAPVSSKRHTLPTSVLCQAQHRRMLHIDSVQPELIILAALVIAVKFTQDPQQPTQFYCLDWGKAMWSHDQLNATERCIMESLNYRIMPLCDEDYLADAMVDMQLAAQQMDAELREQTPPRSVCGSDDDAFVPGHSRSKTAVPKSHVSDMS